MNGKATLTISIFILLLGFSLVSTVIDNLWAQTKEVVAVYFEPDTEGIGPGNKAVIKEKINSLQNLSDIKILLEGYSDITGRADYNLRLSKERAELVKNYLVELGVDSSQIEVIGKGGTEKYAQGETEDALARNRRVNMIIEIPAEPAVEEDSPDTQDFAEDEQPDDVRENEIEAIREETPQTSTIALSNITEKIEKAIRQSAPKGIIFTTPKDMQIGGSYTVEAEVSYAFIDALSKDLEGFRLGDQVGLSLSGGGFSISDKGLDVKTINKGSPATWQWQVLPETKGLKSLVLSVAIASQNAVLDDTYPTFNRVVDVKSSMIHSITSSYWVMGVLIALIIVIVAWILARRVKLN